MVRIIRVIGDVAFVIAGSLIIGAVECTETVVQALREARR